MTDQITPNSEPDEYIRIKKSEYDRLLQLRNELAALKLREHEQNLKEQSDQLLENLINADHNPQPKERLPLTRFLTSALTSPTQHSKTTGPAPSDLPGRVDPPPTDHTPINPDDFILDLSSPPQTLGIEPQTTPNGNPTNIYQAIAQAAAIQKEKSKHHTHKETQKITNKPFPYAEIYAISLDYMPPGFVPIEPVIINTIMRATELGVSQQKACALAGMPSRTFNLYKARAKQDVEPYRTFFDLLEIAEARAETRLVGHWQQAAQEGNWQAAERLLAKRFSQDWGDRRLIDLTLSDLQNLSHEELQVIAGEDIIDVTPTSGATVDNDPDAPTNRPR